MIKSVSLVAAGVVVGASIGVPGAIAAKKISGHDIKNESLTGKDVRDGSLKSSDFSQTYTWSLTVRSDSPNLSAQTIPAGSIVTPVRAEFTSQQCVGGPVSNPEAASFQIKLVSPYGEAQLVQHPFGLQSQATGASADHLAVVLPECGAGMATATLVFTFEVRAGGQGQAKAFG